MNSSRFSRMQSQMITNAPFQPFRKCPETALRHIVVHSRPGNRAKGCITAGNLRFSCALGKGGTTGRKREGDGATPLGEFRLRQLWYRPDQGQRPVTGLPMRRIKPGDGWCDAPHHRLYNRPVSLPFPASHESMWRQDHLYNYVIEIGWNDRPAIPGRGSAIFFHLARPGYKPTEGCVAITGSDMRKLLARIGPRTRIVIR